MKATQEQVNDTLIYIKNKYPESNDNLLTFDKRNPNGTPLKYINDDSFLEQVNRSQLWVQWAKGVGLRKTINISYTSYTIKHIIEDCEFTKGYVCNMATIVALILCDVSISSDGNPYTNLSTKSFKVEY
jgi:hypothetical protein